MPNQIEIRKSIISQLRTVYDPELPINIWDLGLVYGVDFDAVSGKCGIMMTFTSPNCPSVDDIVNSIKESVLSIPEVNSVDIDIVWDPPWDKSQLSEEILLEIGMY